MEYNLGETIKKLRETRGLTQKQLESRCGVFHTIISRIENNKITDPKLSTIVSLAAGLDIDAGDLLKQAAPESASNRIISKLRDHEKKLEEEFGVLEIGLFGSYARGDQTPASDLDFLVKLAENKKDIFNQSRLRRFLEDLFDQPADVVLAENTGSSAPGSELEDEIIHA